MNDTIHTLKLTQMVLSVSREWHLPHFILKILITPEMYSYETAPPIFNAELEGILLAV